MSETRDVAHTYRFPYRQEAAARAAILQYQRRCATFQTLALTGLAASIDDVDFIRVQDLVVVRGCTPERAVALVTRIPLKSQGPRRVA